MSDQDNNETNYQTACSCELHNGILGKKTKKDVYQKITDKIISALETGVAPWVKPWASCGVPRNALS